MISYDIYLTPAFLQSKKIFTPFRKKKNDGNKNKNKKSVSNKNERRCRDVKTQNAQTRLGGIQN